MMLLDDQGHLPTRLQEDAEAVGIVLQEDAPKTLLTSLDLAETTALSSDRVRKALRFLRDIGVVQRIGRRESVVDGRVFTIQPGGQTKPHETFSTQFYYYWCGEALLSG